MKNSKKTSELDKLVERSEIKQALVAIVEKMEQYKQLKIVVNHRYSVQRQIEEFYHQIRTIEHCLNDLSVKSEDWEID